MPHRLLGICQTAGGDEQMVDLIRLPFVQPTTVIASYVAALLVLVASRSGVSSTCVRNEPAKAPSLLPRVAPE